MPEKRSKLPLVWAILWSLLTVGMGAGIIWALPTVAPLPVLALGVCLLNALMWWGTFFRGRKNSK